ncbi:cathepsin L2-like isoform X1 [Liolophura sinensis]
MQPLVLLSLITGFVSALPVSPDLNGQWMLFKSLYNKTYTPEDEPSRRLVWEANVRYIEKHNHEASQGLHTFVLGQNKFADMTVKEFSRLMNGYRMSNKSREGTAYLPPSNVKLPDTMDWRKEGYVTPVKNQEQCGSCWAFSTTGSLEGQHFKKTGQLISLSEQNLVDCSTSEGNMGCNGGLMDQAFKYINKNNGIDNELSYPYEALDEPCRFRVADVSATDTGYTDINKGSEDDLKSASATVGPISVAIDASHSSFQ